MPNLPEKLKLKKEKRQLESKHDEAWHEYDGAAKEIEKKLKQKISKEKLFTIWWKSV